MKTLFYENPAYRLIALARSSVKRSDRAVG